MTENDKNGKALSEERQSIKQEVSLQQRTVLLHQVSDSVLQSLRLKLVQHLCPPQSHPKCQMMMLVILTLLMTQGCPVLPPLAPITSPHLPLFPPHPHLLLIQACSIWWHQTTLCLH